MAANVKLGGVTDMTVGTPWKVILRFSIPLLLGNLFQQMYNTVDAAVVGRYMGSEALAAVGTSGPIINLMVGLFIGFSVGAGILISQFFGAKNEQAIRRAINTAWFLTLVTGFLVTVVGIQATPWILQRLHTPEEIYPMACSYLWVIFLGVTISMYYNMAASVLRALGDSWTPLLALGIASICNIILDLFFVVVLKRGVAGVAWATITAQLISVLFSAWRMNRIKNYTKITCDSLHPDRHMVGGMIKTGLPAAVQQTAFSLGMILIQTVINDFGKYVMAAYVVVMKVDALCILPITTLGLAMTSYSGQNIGAGDLKRVEAGTHQGIVLSMSITLCLSVLLFFAGKYPLMLFTDEPALIQESTHLLRILCPFYWMLSVIDVLAGVMRGAGNTIIPMLNSMLCQCFIRIPLLFFLMEIFQTSDVLYWSMVIGWACGFVFITAYYKSGWWKRRVGTFAALAQEKRED